MNIKVGYVVYNEKEKLFLQKGCLYFDKNPYIWLKKGHILGRLKATSDYKYQSFSKDILVGSNIYAVSLELNGDEKPESMLYHLDSLNKLNWGFYELFC